MAISVLCLLEGEGYAASIYDISLSLLESANVKENCNKQKKCYFIYTEYLIPANMVHFQLLITYTLACASNQ